MQQKTEKVAEARTALAVKLSESKELLARAGEPRELLPPKCPHCQSESNGPLIRLPFDLEKAISIIFDDGSGFFNFR